MVRAEPRVLSAAQVHHEKLKAATSTAFRSGLQQSDPSFSLDDAERVGAAYTAGFKAGLPGGKDERPKGKESEANTSPGLYGVFPEPGGLSNEGRFTPPPQVQATVSPTTRTPTQPASPVRPSFSGGYFPQSSAGSAVVSGPGGLPWGNGGPLIIRYGSGGPKVLDAQGNQVSEEKAYLLVKAPRGSHQAAGWYLSS